MIILNALKQLRDDIKTWVTNNLNALNAKIDEKTIPIDNELDSNSTNPVQNQAIAKEINSINDRVGTTSVATQISRAINAQEHFSGDYNDLTNAPNITEDDSGNMIIADESGNVIFKVDADGIHTTALFLNGESTATESYVDNAIAEIPAPDVSGPIETHNTSEASHSDIRASISELNTLVGDTTVSKQITDAIAKIPTTDLTDYYTKSETDTAIGSAKEELSESIVAESEEWKVVDEAGNIIFSVDADGAHTTALTLNGESVEDIVDDRLALLVDSAPDTLNTLNELASALGDDPNFATTVAAEIGKKVDKEDGKGLSTNDFTDDYKDTLDNLSNMQFDETDPTVPAWAKAEKKPTYTADEVGALPDTTTLSDLEDDATHRTVTDDEKSSWNAKSDFSGNYGDLVDAPDIVEDDNGNLVIADASGNIVFRSDADGFETTRLTANEVIVNGKDLEDALSEKLDSSSVSTVINDTLAQAKASGEFDGPQGPQGPAGQNGADGEDGVSVTHSWNGTTLTVTSSSGTSSANLKGDKGDTGETGPAGAAGYSPVRGTDYWTAADIATIKSYVDDAILGGAW